MTTLCDVIAYGHKIECVHVMSVCSFSFHFTVLREIFTGLETLCLEEVEEISSLRKCYKS